MNKHVIKNKLTENHDMLVRLAFNLTEKDFLYSAGGKWTAGQQVEHICRSIFPVRLAFSVPKLMLKVFFGRANRPSRDYDALVARYLQKLEGKYRIAERFEPQPLAAADKPRLQQQLEKSIVSLLKNIDKYSEEQLDQYVLPHPLLGKLTLREMLYFVIYHAEHHRKLILRNLAR